MTRLALLLLLLLAGMMGRAQGAPVLGGVDDPQLAAAAGQIQAHAGAHRLLVLGELHGTREMPALTAQLLQRYAALGPVTLALEMPHTEQAALDAYLASAGAVQDWRILASTPFWQVSNDQHDGRRSLQMRQLVEVVRALRQAGASADVLAYDVSRSESDTHDHHWRDARMADNLRAAIERTSGTVVVLTGNVHAMRVRPDWAPAELQLAPMTSLLLDLQPFVVNLTAAEGQFWGCMEGRCRALPVRTQMPQPLLRFTEPERTYDLVLQLPVLSVADLVEPQG